MPRSRRTNPRVALRCPSRTRAIEMARNPSRDGKWSDFADLFCGKSVPVPVDMLKQSSSRMLLVKVGGYPYEGC